MGECLTLNLTVYNLLIGNIGNSCRRKAENEVIANATAAEDNSVVLRFAALYTVRMNSWLVTLRELF